MLWLYWGISARLFLGWEKCCFVLLFKYRLKKKDFGRPRGPLLDILEAGLTAG